MRYHLDANTGNLTRVLERGTRSMSFLLNSMVFNVVPTALEVTVVTGILGYNFGAPTASVVVGTIGAYVGWTVGITQWRTQFRRNMNAVENKAGGRISDSLINYEAVKVFTAENHEVEKYGGLLKEVSTTEL